MREFFQYSKQVVQNRDLFLLLLNLVVEVFKRGLMQLPDKVSFLLVRAALDQVADDEFIAVAESAFQSIFSLDRNFRGLIGKSNIWDLFSSVFFELKSKAAVEFVNRLLFTDAQPVYYQGYSGAFFDQFARRFAHPEIGGEFAAEILAFVASLFSIFTKLNRKSFKVLVKSNALRAFDGVAALVSDPVIRAAGYQILLLAHNDDLSPPPHHEIVAHVVTVSKGQPDLAPILFDHVLEALDQNREAWRPLSAVVSIRDLFDLKKVSPFQRIRFLSIASEALPSETSALVRLLFADFVKQNLPADVEGERFRLAGSFSRAPADLVDRGTSLRSSPSGQCGKSPMMVLCVI
jgi:hypothetical protein